MKVSTKKWQPPNTVRVKGLKHFGNDDPFHEIY